MWYSANHEIHSDNIDDDFTDILDARLRQRESDVEGYSDKHVSCCHQDVSNAHVSTLQQHQDVHCFGFFCCHDSFPHIVLLVLVVAHDGDDRVVDEQAQRQDSGEARER